MGVHREQLPQRIEVLVWECERGWGNKIDEILYFYTLQEAQEYVKNFNACNDKDVVPDWYMYAEIRK